MQSNNQIQHQQTASTGRYTAVGDATTGSVFTGGADGGNSLWFEGTTADDYEIILTGADATLSRQDNNITRHNRNSSIRNRNNKLCIKMDRNKYIRNRSNT